MLKFDPANRISVDAALRHPFLAPFHSEEKFRNAQCQSPMSIDIESVGEDPDHLFDSVSVRKNYILFIVVGLFLV